MCFKKECVFTSTFNVCSAGLYVKKQGTCLGQTGRRSHTILLAKSPKIPMLPCSAFNTISKEKWGKSKRGELLMLRNSPSKAWRIVFNLSHFEMRQEDKRTKRRGWGRTTIGSLVELLLQRPVSELMFRSKDSGRRPCLGFRVRGLGIRVQGSGFMVYGWNNLAVVPV